MEKYRFDKDVGLHYIAFGVAEWLPVFIDQSSCRILIENFEFCIRLSGFANHCPFPVFSLTVASSRQISRAC